MAKGTTIRMWRRTLFLPAIFMVVGFGTIIFSLVRLQLVEGESLQERAVKQQMKDTTIPVMRGAIYDYNMHPLVQSATIWAVVLEPVYLTTDEQRETIAEGLSQVLGMNKNEILEHAKKKSCYNVLKRKVEAEVKGEILKFKEEKETGSGARLIEDYKRYYPSGSFAATLLGFTGTDNQGLSGLEAHYDKQLTGTAGRLVTAENAIGTDIPFQYEQKVEAQNGYSLALTIDEIVQHFLEEYLEEGVVNNKAKNHATAIVMDVKTGAILGLAAKGNSDSDFPLVISDPTEAARVANISDGDDTAGEGKRIRKAKSDAKVVAQQTQQKNKAVSNTYYPGSIFKMIVGSVGMEEGVVNEDTQFFCNGAAVVSDTTIRCWESGGHSSETFIQGLVNSCNPILIKAGEILGAERFFKYFATLGLTEKTGIDPPGKAGSLYYTASQLNPVESATELLGQDFSITPIQMATAAAMVTNGGYLIQSHLVSQMLGSNGNIVQSVDVKVKRQVISGDVSRRMSKIPQMNATTGTAKDGYLPDYHVVSKTGISEEVTECIAGGKKEMEYIVSYYGFAPADDPQIALLVFFGEPAGGSCYGGAIVGPVFGKMMEEILPYLGIERKYTDAEMEKLDIATPDMTSRRLDVAKAALQKLGLKQKVYGSGGTVLKQIPGSGKSTPQNGTVVLMTDVESKNRQVTVPNLMDMTLTQANSAVAEAGINITVSGAALTGGRAQSHSQSIAAGTRVSPGTVVSVGFVEFDQVQ